MLRAEIKHARQVLVQGRVLVGDQELKADVCCAEVVDQVPEEVAVLPQLVKVTLLHAPVVHIDLQINLDEIAQLH